MAKEFRSDKWADKPDEEIVHDIYGNRIKWGVLEILKERGYYNNWREKAHSTDGTYKTYGEEYSVDKGADPNKYVDEI